MTLIRSKRSLLLGSAMLAVTLAAALAIFLATKPPKIIIGGPIGPPAGENTECITSSPGTSYTWGIDELINQESSVAVVEKISLRSPRGLNLLGSYLVPIVPVPARTRSYLVGEWASFPPPSRQLDSFTGLEWAKREKPRNARLLPGHRYNAVIGVRATTRQTGAEQGLAVYYRVGSQQYLFTTNSRLMIKTLPAACS